jgi:hypothetical protein
VEPGYAMVDEGGWLGRSLPYQAKWYDKVDPGVLDVMVMLYHSVHRWNRIGAVYASDICQPVTAKYGSGPPRAVWQDLSRRGLGYIGHRSGQTFLLSRSQLRC